MTGPQGTAGQSRAWRSAIPGTAALRRPVKIKFQNQSGGAGSERVVPLRKSRVGLERKLSHHAVWHGYTGRIGVEIEAGRDGQSSGGARCPDEADDGVEI